VCADGAVACQRFAARTRSQPPCGAQVPIAVPSEPDHDAVQRASKTLVASAIARGFANGPPRRFRAPTRPPTAPRSHTGVRPMFRGWGAVRSLMSSRVGDLTLVHPEKLRDGAAEDSLSLGPACSVRWVCGGMVRRAFSGRRSAQRWRHDVRPPSRTCHVVRDVGVFYQPMLMPSLHADVAADADCVSTRPGTVLSAWAADGHTRPRTPVPPPAVSVRPNAVDFIASDVQSNVRTKLLECVQRCAVCLAAVVVAVLGWVGCPR
jgi:hypothetical protein